MSRVLRSFREMLGLLSRGTFSEKLDQTMTDVIETLENMPADKGKATITVAITFNYELGRIDIDPTMKVKLPETARFMKTPFWIADGALSVEHPNQIDMFPVRNTSWRERENGSDDDEAASAGN